MLIEKQIIWYHKIPQSLILKQSLLACVDHRSSKCAPLIASKALSLSLSLSLSLFSLHTLSDLFVIHGLRPTHATNMHLTTAQ